MDLKHYIRDIPDFPTPGILFKDITPLLGSPQALSEAVNRLADPYRGKHVDLVVSAEARGFIFGAAVAYALGAGFVPVRKPGKLPWRTVAKTYELEYGTDTLCMHEDAVRKGQNVLLLDDLLATGGTVAACADLVVRSGARIVGCAFVIELTFLEGRRALAGYDVMSLIRFDSE